jgi:hypothetical protein
MNKSFPVALKLSWLYRLGALGVVLLGLVAHAHGQCTTPANAIVAENCLPGNPSSQWDTNNSDAGDLSIQGFATDISSNQGGTVNFKINTNASAYTIDIYRIGYYGGMGARKVASISPSAHLPQAQPACLGDTTTGLTDCGNWAISASWQVPANAVSGVYFAHLTRTDTGGDSHIVFIVRNDSSHSDILYQTSDTTWEAYNYYGNGSLYGAGVPEFGLSVRSYKVSYNRPFLTRSFNNESATYIFGAEFAMIQFLEANGYDVTYSSGVDTARSGALIKNHKIFMDSGHDEYVSPDARASIQAARDAGVNLAFFSGNEIFWKTRWENSIDGTNTPYRTIVCYKETLAFAKIDPEDPPTWTGTWRDPSFSPPADGGLPENALTGTLFMVNGTGDDNPGNLTIKVPAEDGKMRFWRNTAVATLAPGATYTLVPGSLGYEWDVDADNGFRPAGAFRLSTTTYNLTTDYLLDFGATYGVGTATHHMMTYRAASGALVFGAGTIDWAYGLNSNHDNSFNFTAPNPDVNMQQATINLLADMGVQPATILAGLRAATKSTDTVPPHSTILSPAVGANISTGGSITVSGTASDTGGVVAGVEVSSDGGTTWHPASGRSTWTYSWTPTTVGSPTLLSRAVDDTGNLETPTDGVIVSVAPQTCPCTIFGQNTPTVADSGDGNAVELGVKFRADSSGNIVGVRFYKSAANTGTHIGHVWSDSGQLLGTATFAGETGSGWQQVNFSTPIPAQANTTYVASYYAPVGHYSADQRFFLQSGYDDPPLHALADGVDGANGDFVYSSGGGFPSTGSNATNYWVDVIYASSNTYSISGSISGPGGDGATVTLTGPESLSTSADASGNYSFGGVVNGTYTAVASNPGVTFAPTSQAVTINFGSVSGVNFVATVTNPLSISGTITGGAGATVALAGPANLTTTADASGNYSFGGLLSGTYTVTPAEPTFIFNPSTQVITLSGSSATNVNFAGQVCTCISIWQPTDVPAVIDSGDSAAVELGVRFTADSPAYLTGIRFYKASTNTGTHVGHLWTSSGQLLATATFPGETASGWQQGYFSSPVLLNAGTVYVASYFAPNGHYSATGHYFAGTGVDRPPLHALADGVSGANGIYSYSSTGGFPSSTFNSTNYWVDVLYAAQPYTISGTITGTGGAGATVNLSGTSQATVTADASGNFTFPNVYGGNYTVTPSNPGYVFNPGSQNVSISQSNVTGVNFTVPQICPCDTVWQPTAAPSRVDSGDTQSVELGVKIRADNDGYILGVRFYKAAANTGTHIGNLWSNSGILLGTGTFINESASGWQQLLFTNPVPVVANTTYVVSYLAPAGHYAADTTFFASNGVDTPPLHALQNGVDGGNGVFSYGSVSTYPVNSFNSTNYWVDGIYAATATHTIAGIISGPGAAGTTVQLQGPTNATTITDGQGNFSFNGVADGSYTLTPSQAGILFSPAVLSVTISGAHDLAANFTSAVPTFSVSGTVAGAPGVSVTLSGATVQTTTADASGNFIFSAVPNGSYTVTPSGVGFAITPTSQPITVNGAAVTSVNFTAVQTLFTISGTVTGGAGATVALTGNSSSSVVADSSGNYTFTGLTVGRYTLAPVTTAGVVFNPGTVTVVLNGSNISGVNFTVPQTCPCDTIWLSSAVPAQTDSGDTNSVELGVKFRVDADAYITGLRFYKAATNTGTHLGRIWTSTGTLLGTATFTSESDSGWQQVFFSSPIPVAANTTYVASYFAPAGHYAADLQYFTNAGVDSPPLHALANSVDGQNGVYGYSATGGFPSQSQQNNGVNYWVDVIYSPTSTYSVTGTITGPGAAGATITVTGQSTATTTADASGNFSLSGLANGSYVVTPSNSGLAFTPASQSIAINGAHVMNVNFTAAAATVVSSVSVNPAAVTGPTSATGTVTLNTPAPSGGAVVTLSSSNTGAAQVPASVTVAANATTATFTVATNAVSTNTLVTISATYGSTQNTIVTVNAPVVSSVAVSPASVQGGASALGTVSLSGPAPTGGSLVTLASSNTAAAQVPASVTVAAGATAATFTVTSSVVASNTGVTISATYGQTQTGSLTVLTGSLSTLTVNPTSVVGGTSSTGTVTLTAAAPAGGAVVTLSSSNASVAQVPASVTVVAGATTANFTIPTSPVASNASATITGTYGAAKTSSLTVTAPTLGATGSGLSVSPTSVVGGISSTGTVRLTGPAPTGGAVVTLSSSNTTAARAPASVTVAAGATTATFTITTSPVASNTSATITAIFGVTRTASLTVTAPTLSGFSLNPTSVIGGSSSTGTVTLSGPAPAGGAAVTLSSSNTTATHPPASVTVLAGATTATFTITTTPVASNTSATITAIFGVTRTASLTVTAPTLSGFSLNPTSVIGGSSSTGTVTLSGPAPAGGAAVTLSSSNTTATHPPASVSVLAGATTATFTITTSPVASNTSATITAIFGVTRTASLTVTSPTLSGVTLSPTSVIGGSSSTGTVTLTGPAPSGGAVVTLSSSNTAAAQVSASVTVPANATTATFTVTTSPVAANASVTITGSRGTNHTSTLTVTAPALTSLTLNPTTVKGLTSSTGTVTISGPAPAAGTVVTLTSSSTAVATVPASVTVLAGNTSATFTITTKSVVNSTNVTISATKGVVRTALLAVTP